MATADHLVAYLALEMRIGRLGERKARERIEKDEDHQCLRRPSGASHFSHALPDGQLVPATTSTGRQLYEESRDLERERACKGDEGIDKRPVKVVVVSLATLRLCFSRGQVIHFSCLLY